MNAKPNLNGNTPEDFRNAGARLHDIAITTKEKMGEADLHEITNGRNYQHIEPIHSARITDLARIAKIVEALDDLEAIGRELYDIGSAG